jgi:DNA modification methylase
MGYDFVGCEKDAEYFLLQEKRFKNWIAQQSLFEMDGGQPALF